MRDFGATEEQIDARREALKPEHYEVLEENWQAVIWFLDVDDLFKTDGGFLTGLDIAAIMADAQMSGRTTNPDDYQKLRVLGRIAANEINNKRAK